jgi:hypothetical protein
MMTPHYLKNNTATIRAIEVDAHRIRFNSATWERQLGKTAVWQQFRSQIPTDSITRGDLFAMAREADAAERLQVLFVASMVWGSGEVGYGAWRSRAALEAPQLGEQLEMLTAKLLSGDLVAACRAVSIPRVGPAFYTKLFYFLCRSRVQRFPLILDTVLMNAFEQLLGLDVGDYAKVTRKHGRVTSILAWPEGYQRYVEQMHDWADALDCTADQIELFLFQALQATQNS